MTKNYTWFKKKSLIIYISFVSLRDRESVSWLCVFFKWLIMNQHLLIQQQNNTRSSYTKDCNVSAAHFHCGRPPLPQYMRRCCCCTTRLSLYPQSANLWSTWLYMLPFRICCSEYFHFKRTYSKAYTYHVVSPPVQKITICLSSHWKSSSLRALAAFKYRPLCSSWI